MGAFGTGSFYSAPHPENIGSPVPDQPQTQTAEQPRPAARPINPPYNRDYANSAASFAPSGGEPEVDSLPVVVAEPALSSLPLIAAGLFALWLIFKGDR